ncbi:MAG: DUF2927 domain-containing protein [Magnetococcales bacterium]|nr:DUF2927 domain-containing protein [Magnetococcales bacterium]
MQKRSPILLIMLLLLLPTTARSTELNQETILRNFEIIAFGSEYQNKTWKGLRKWVDPVRIGLQGKYPSYLEDEIKQFTADLTSITSHPVGLYYSHSMKKNHTLPKNFNRKKVNVIVFYEPLHNIKKKLGKYFKDRPHELDILLKEATCFAKFFTRRFEIRAAIVVIPDHISHRYARACVVEEISQILGLPNDSNLVGDSIFRDRGKYNELTSQDRLLLRILYDHRLVFGMSRPETLEQVSIFLPELMEEGK